MADIIRGIDVPNFMGELVDENRQRNLYMNAKKNNAKNIKKKKEADIKKKFATAAIAGAGFILGVLAMQGYKQYKGSEIIAERFATYTEGYGIDNMSYGYVAFHDGKEISIESAMEDIINDARYDGMTDVEIGIGLSKVYGGNFEKNYIGEISFKEKMAANEKAYHENGLEHVKNSGGISR